MNGEVIKPPDDFFINDDVLHYVGAATCSGCGAATSVPDGPIVQRRSIPGGQFCCRCYEKFPKHVLDAFNAARAAKPVPEPQPIPEVPPAPKGVFGRLAAACGM